MRKTIAFLLVLVMLLSITGCSSADKPAGTTDSSVPSDTGMATTTSTTVADSSEGNLTTDGTGNTGDSTTQNTTAGTGTSTIGQTEGTTTTSGSTTNKGTSTTKTTTKTTTTTTKTTATTKPKEEEKPMDPVTESSSEQFRNQKFGIFVHYVPGLSVDAQGKTYDIQTTANRFDAVGFAKDIASTGAEYIIFTVWHAGMYPLYPSKVMEQYRPGCCSQRDVIGDMLTEMEKYGIKVWLYTHPYLGYHMSNADRISTGYGVGNHPGDSNKPNPETFQYDKWNDYVNALYKELVERYAGRIQGLFLDEGLPGAGMDEFIDYPRLRNTIKKADSSVLMMQNFYGTNYSCDFGMKEYGPGWGEFRQEYEGAWPCYELPVGTVISQDWMATKPSSTPVLRYMANSLFRYTVLEAACNVEGGGTCWAASPYVGGGWEQGVLSTLQEVGELYKEIQKSLANTRPSTSYPVVSGTTIGNLPYGVAATQSKDGKTEYLHVLTPPTGNTLYLPAPKDGKVFKSAQLLVGGTALSLEQTASGVTITLPKNVDWNELDTVIVLSVSRQNEPKYSKYYIRDTDTAIKYEGYWEYSRWERNHGDYEGDMHETNRGGTSVSYTFTGVGIEWLTSCSPEQGVAKVWLDDVYQGTFSAQASVYKAQQTPFSAFGLSEGEHTIRIEYGTGLLCVDGFIVTK